MKDTPLSDAALREFPRFVAAVAERLEAGRRTYGDESHTRPLPELLGELRQEALDLAGWGFLVWQRVSALERLVRREPKP